MAALALVLLAALLRLVLFLRRLSAWKTSLLAVVALVAAFGCVTTQSEKGFVSLFDGKTLNGWTLLGKKGVKGGNDSRDTFNGMADVAIAKNGDFFIADGEGPNTRVVKFDKDGKFIKSWGKTGYGPGEFRTLHGIAIDSRGRVFVADRGNNRIQLFDQDGKHLSTWTQFGTPSGIAFATQPRNWVWLNPMMGRMWTINAHFPWAVRTLLRTRGSRPNTRIAPSLATKTDQ